jgi:hypothetical protein
MKTRFLFSMLGAAALLFVAGTASASPQYAPAGTAFTFQGRLTDGGAPASGAYDFEFSLYDADVGGSQVGVTITQDDVTVTGGLFTVQLDFGDVFDGTALYLEIAVRPGSETGAYTTLSPRQPLTAAPYALYAEKSPWAGLTGMAAGAGIGLTLNGNQFNVDTSVIQRRIGGTCAVGNAIRLIDAEGNVTCESVVSAGGDITAVIAGDGLSGGALSGDANLAVSFAGTGAASTVARSDHNHDGSYVQVGALDSITSPMIVNGAIAFADLANICTNGQVMKTSSGAWTCGTDENTTYTAGTGLTLGGNEFSVSFAGTGGATTAARSDHEHWGQSWTGSGTGLVLSGGQVGLNGSGSSQGVIGTGELRGIDGESNDGTGVYGHGGNTGVYGDGGPYGVRGDGTVDGVWGRSDNTGVFGSGGPVGVKGFSSADGGFGVYGQTTGTNGNGVYGYSSAAGSTGVYGRGSIGVSGAGSSYGVFGTSSSTFGVYGYSEDANSAGVSGHSSSTGVYGTGNTGVYGVGTFGVLGAGTTYGVEGTSGNIGVYGHTGNVGVSGEGSTYGVSGTSANWGVYGYSATQTGVHGAGGPYGVEGTGSTYGVHGYGGPIGVQGDGTTYGVHGTGLTGVFGDGSSYPFGGVGVYGLGSSGVYAASSTIGGNGVLGRAYGGTGNYAGFFEGNVKINGDSTVTGTKSAVVATQDYGTRALYSVESAESWFEDFGTGQLANGEAVITIEPIFAQTVNLTADYHVFLTPLGDCALYVNRKSPTSFSVRATGGQTCSTAFDYRIVAKRLGYEHTRLAEVNAAPPAAEPH